VLHTVVLVLDVLRVVVQVVEHMEVQVNVVLNEVKHVELQVVAEKMLM